MASVKPKINLKAQTKQKSANQSAIVADANDPSLMQIPQDFFVQSRWKSHALWFKMTARELIGQKTGGRGGTLNIGRKGTTFKFLAPLQFIDTQQHTWEEYSSIQSRLLQFLISGQVAYGQLAEVYENIKQEFLQKGFKISGANIKAALERVSNVHVPKFKQDTPLRYVKSARRSYQFTFVLADAAGGSYMQRAIELLQKYAAPESTGITSINFPYIFRVETEPFGLITLQYAALESIMVTWMAPYISGKPCRAEITLSFKDMSPLFRKTIETGGIINVNEPPEVKAEQKQELARLQRAMEGYHQGTSKTAEEIIKGRPNG